ncbi:MAG: hypothetical protein PHY59_05310 [Methanobacterium sp.]|nr:hypothetical protein [Methanobacterium sp.]
MKRNHIIVVIIGIIIFLFILFNSNYYNNTNSNDIRVAYIPCDHESALFVAETQICIKIKV